MTKEYDELKAVLQRSSVDDVLAALLEVWDRSKIVFLLEEMEIEFDVDEETESTH